LTQEISKDRLDSIFALQKGLADMMDLDRYPTDVEGRVAALCTAIIHEAVELQRTTNWKWWKKPTQFNKAGSSLIALYKNSLDGDGRIINSHSPDPFLTVSKTEVKKFQSRVRIINKIGITNFEEISSLVHSIQN